MKWSGTGLLLCLAASCVSAADGYWQLGHRIGWASHDNYNLNDDDKHQVQVGADDASVSIGRESERDRLQLSLQHRWRQYAGEADDLKTSQAPELSLDWNHRPDDRSTVDLSLDYLRNRTSADEFETYFENGRERLFLEAQDVDKERERGTVSLNATYMATPRWQWFGGVSGTDLQHRSAGATALMDYHDTSWNGGAYFLVDEHWDLYLQGAYSTYLPRPSEQLIQQLNATRSRSKSLSLGLRIRFPDGANLNASLGQRLSYLDRPLDGRFEKGRGTVATLSFSRPYEYGQWNVSGSRSLQPDSTGEIVDNEDFSVSVRRNMSVRLSHDLSWSWRRERPPEIGVQQQPGTVNRIWAWQMNYRVGEHHTFGFGLQHRQYRELRQNEGNRVELSWRWTGPKNRF